MSRQQRDLPRRGGDQHGLTLPYRHTVPFGIDQLARTCDEIRPTYHHVESCQETVPQAITAFLESTDFEDALRTAVSLGGDSDTLAAITGSIAEAFYGVPEELRHECRKRLPPELAEILREWESALYNEKICGRI